MISLRKNNKGSLQDLVFIGGVLLFFSLVLLIGSKVMGELNTEIQASSNIDTHGKTASAALNSEYAGSLDYGMLFLAIGLGIVTLILAVAVRIHPIFIPLYFIGLVIVIFVSGVFAKIYQEMAATSQLTAYADQLVFTSHILNYLPLIVGIFGILLMVIMYKLWSAGSEI